MQRSLFGACSAHTGLIKKLVTERQWDTGPANREHLCGPSCRFGQRLFLQAEPCDAFLCRAALGQAVLGGRRAGSLMPALPPAVEAAEVAFPPRSLARSSCRGGQDPSRVLLHVVAFPKHVPSQARPPFCALGMGGWETRTRGAAQAFPVLFERPTASTRQTRCCC